MDDQVRVRPTPRLDRFKAMIERAIGSADSEPDDAERALWELRQAYQAATKATEWVDSVCCAGTGYADYAAVRCPAPDCPVPEAQWRASARDLYRLTPTGFAHTHNPDGTGVVSDDSEAPLTAEQRHEIDPMHEWYRIDGCPVCAREAAERRYGHLTEDERRYLALAARDHADVQTRTAELWRNNAKNDTLAAAHRERAARWREIADGFHTDPWGNGS